MSRLTWVWIAMAAAGSLTVAAQEPQYRAGAHNVSIYATVVDREGRLVPDLTRDDFEIYDNGVKQPLDIFVNDVQPITIVVMLDRSASMSNNADLVKHAAEQFVTTLQPDDRARIGSFSYAVRIDPDGFTSDHDALLRVLHEDLLGEGPTPLWNATNAAMAALSPYGGRKVVLLFTDGEDSPGTRNFNSSFTEVRDRAQMDEIMVYAIGLADDCASRAPAPAVTPDAGAMLFQRRTPGAGGGRGGPRIGGRTGGRQRPPGGPTFPPIGGGGFGRPGRPAPPPPPPGMPDPRGGISRPGPSSDDKRPCRAKHPDPQLRELAAEGGGGYFELHGTDDLTTTFTRVADELHHQYLLAFRPTTLDGQVHSLEVRVKSDAHSVRARRSYLAK